MQPAARHALQASSGLSYLVGGLSTSWASSMGLKYSTLEVQGFWGDFVVVVVSKTQHLQALGLEGGQRKKLLGLTRLWRMGEVYLEGWGGGLSN